MTPTDFAKALSHYLGVYLPGQRNLSTNTLKSYRDAFKLFLRYCCYVLPSCRPILLKYPTVHQDRSKNILF